MTRRVRMGPLQTLGRSADRMAPGGRRSASESPVHPFRRQVRAAGPTPAGPMSVTLRPVLIEGFIPAIAAHPDSSTALTLVGGAGNSTLSDQSDSTYARMTAESLGGNNNIYIGSVRATFSAPTLTWEPSSAVLTVRTRALVDTHPPAPADPGAVYWEFRSPGGFLYSKSSQFTPNTRWRPTSSWTDMPSDDWGGYPSASDVAAGVRVEINATAWRFDPALLQLDVADMWLQLEGA